METKELKEQLFYKKQSVYEKADEKAIDAAYDFAVDYMKYLDDAKTEREAVDAAIVIAEAAGFKPYSLGQALNVGDKLYYNNRGKNLFLLQSVAKILKTVSEFPRLISTLPESILSPFPSMRMRA